MYLSQQECLPGARLARYFCINCPDFNPGFTVPQRRPPKHSGMSCNPALQSTLHKTKIANSTSTTVTCHVANKQCYPHKCEGQYI